MPSTWRPSGLLKGQADNAYAIIILNQPINKRALDAVVERASLLICADAGADRLHALQKTAPGPMKLPDVVVGDLDSLSEGTERYYKEKGVSIVKDPDQYSTDFTKALKWARKKTIETGAQDTTLDVVVLGGLGGRVDQGFSQIHHLYMAQQDDDLLHGRIYLLSEQNLTFILDEGDNDIFIEPETFEENVGIIPVLGPTKISTKGLEWDVHDWSTAIGGQLSTSNHLRSDKISLKIDGTRPLMTMELAKHFCMTP